MYWRCSANSVEKPVNGERCKPDMNPSPTVRASNASEVIRASTSGARNLGAPMADCGLRIADSSIADCGLRIADCPASSPTDFLNSIFIFFIIYDLTQY